MSKISYSILFSILIVLGCKDIKQTFKSKEPWDSTYRPDIFVSRVSMINSFKHSTNDIVLVGNSLIFWSEFNNILDNPNIKNHGIPGDNTFGVLQRLDRIASDKPSKIFILIGLNDLSKGAPISVMIENYKRMVEKIKRISPQTIIYLLSIFPTNEVFGKLEDHYHHDKEIVQVNEAMKDLALKSNIVYVDIYRHFVDKNGRLIKSLTWDGVHLNLKGNTLWAKVLTDRGYL
jgi:lysophospholipase L1-like esterase